MTTKPNEPRRANSIAWLAFCAACLCLFLDGGAARAQTQGACQPRVRVKTLLDSLQVGGRGALSIGKLYAECLPEPVRRSQGNYGYNPYDGGKLSAVLKASNGQPLNTYVFYAEKITSMWEISRYEVVGGPQAVKPLAVGSYSLDFAHRRQGLPALPLLGLDGREQGRVPPRDHLPARRPVGRLRGAVLPEARPLHAALGLAARQGERGRAAQRDSVHAPSRARARRQADRGGRRRDLRDEAEAAVGRLQAELQAALRPRGRLVGIPRRASCSPPKATTASNSRSAASPTRPTASPSRAASSSATPPTRAKPRARSCRLRASRTTGRSAACGSRLIEFRATTV